MGFVYKGRDALIGRDVAIKVILEQALESPQIKQRFYREARSAGRLSHPNITTIHDLGEENGQPYLVMEYLDGADLNRIMREGLPLSNEQKLLIAVQICHGLLYAHEHQVVHRDIKPANIRVLENGHIKIMDFGIARLQSETQALTQTNTSLGTPRYMSPEQIRNESVNHRTDIFSFGVLLYELFMGENPFAANNVAAIIYKVLHSRPGVFRTTPTALSEVLEPIVSKCLEKDQTKRYQTFMEVLEDLEPLVARFGDGAGRTSPLAGLKTGERDRKRPPSRPLIPILSAKKNTSQADTIIQENLTEQADKTITLKRPPAKVTPPDRTAPPRASTPAPAAKKSREYLYVLGVLGILLVAAVGYLLVPVLFDSAPTSATPPLAEITPQESSPGTETVESETAAPEETPGPADTPPPASTPEVQPPPRQEAVSQPEPVERPVQTPPRETTPPPTATTPPPTPTTGILVLDSQPSGASIYIDGTERGTTPSRVTDIEAGRHNIVFRLDGYEEFAQSILLTQGQTRSVSPTLNLLMGTLRVSMIPGGRLLVDGEVISGAVTSSASAELRVGRHTVTVEHPEYGTWERTVDIARGTPQTFTVDFNRTATVIVTAFDTSGSPVRGEIYVDGQAQGAFAPRSIDVRIGRRRIEVRQEGYVMDGEVPTLQIDQDRSEPLRLTLRRRY